jgi:para-aminobenzoate synthetase/4-amino-4-deoxychorismate lyase
MTGMGQRRAVSVAERFQTDPDRHDPTSPLSGMSARFDDLTPQGHSFVLSEPVEEFIARRPEQVKTALLAAESAARCGLWVAGFVTYEAATGLDASLSVREWPPDHPLSTLPLVWFGAFKHRDEVEACQPDPAADQRPDWRLDRDRDWYRAAFDSVQQLITGGDSYQLNLTVCFASEVVHPTRLYAQLASAQGGAYNALIVTPDHAIISASPELFFTRVGDQVVTRPMKGTASRGRWPEEDIERVQEMLESAKERAENIMIVDLVRNDLGRVAVYGSVRVPTLFEAERYPTVWQLTSTISAQCPREVDLATLFAALFPSGSITGAPKRRTMQAIAEIEGRPRGVYCGAIGFLSPNPVQTEARFSVAIRTVTVSHRSCYAEYGTGGGITTSSDPDSEWTELLTKAAILRRPARPEGLIETLRFDPSQGLVNLQRHLGRLRSSAEYFRFRYEEGATLAALKSSLAYRHRAARVRISLLPSGDVDVRVYDLTPNQPVVRVGLAEEPVDSADVLLFHKQADRSRYERFRGTSPDLDDVVLWNEGGLVTEATTANLAVHLGDRWWTPSLASGLLPGVERGRLLDARLLRERAITVDELTSALAIALVSSLRGWRHVEIVPDLRSRSDRSSSRHDRRPSEPLSGGRRGGSCRACSGA